ncbi:hypothetical protein [Aliiroseovarius sp.]|uniref:hypothetical protein n=1 Tax=Aliiroseovarius sp. TaxID=1872442 RepID=UPI002628A41A|nr:hypothetical protein [Aliiroseovarius sp.]
MMERPNAVMLAGGLAALFILLAGTSLAPGALLVGKHEGDTFHIVDVLMRMARGEVPHLDFATPIGVLAFAPIVLFLKAGFGVGMAMIMGQVLIAALVFPALWWVAHSRFSTGWAVGFGAAVLVLLLGLVHGTTEPSLSMSMHYNRWAWAATFLVLAAAVLPGRGADRPLADGLVIGLGLSLMALTKVTFFVAFALPVVVALVARGAWRSLAVSVLAGLAVVAVVTGVMSVEFWMAWLGDLRTVSSSLVRPQPTLNLGQVIGAPSHMAGTLVLIFAVVLLRQADRPAEGLILLLLAPGFIYVTWQNAENDPQWLMLLGVMLFALVPTRELHNVLGWNVSAGIGYLGIAAITLSVPSFINMAWSPFRHLNTDRAAYMPLLPGQGIHEDLQVARIRNLDVGGAVPLGLPTGDRDASGQEEVARVNGEALPQCNLGLGMSHWMATIATRLNESGLARDQQVFVTDVLNVTWLYGAGEPLQGGAPWYYGGLSGFANADLVLVPLCPISAPLRKLMLTEIEADGAQLTEIDRTDLYILYRK